MFVDLKNSTSIAEELGHIRYSQFIQDCFFDLHVVEAYGAEVYQYVGDEVVLSWHVKPNIDFTNCLHAFWAFEDKLRLSGGDEEVVPEVIPGLFVEGATTNASFTTPSEPGAYRIFVYVDDEEQRTAHENIPFLVEK